ncbi:MAG: ABC-F family ATP-binding cassette domain-containing protein [Planctomycetes bacterium]|nr:ABC-F family ATP-binding cassette domain-containing protein [Planctomycetota bacterium]
MSIVALQSVSKSYDSRAVLTEASFDLGSQERVGLVGPNGEGKSTLLRLLAGVETPDGGLRTAMAGIRIGFFTQEPRLDPGLRVRDAVRAGLGNRDELHARLEALHTEMARPGLDADALTTLIEVQEHLETRLAGMGGHNVEHRVDEIISHLGLRQPDALCGSLSGGEARRVSLAAMLLSEPDVLLLDEPTNHLDVVAIDWLEDFLLASKTPLVMVTHDRYFLDRVVHRIVEVDRGRLYSTDGGYQDFLVQQATRLAAEANTEQNRLATIRRETAWIRRGAHGRTTKEKARVNRYRDMVAQPELESRIELDFAIPRGPRLGGKVIRAAGVSKMYGPREILRDVNLEITAGMRLGIVGANGTGKTTLLRVLTGKLAPDAGAVEIGETVRVADIDQSRSVLDDSKSVVEEVADNEDGIVKVDGQLVRVAPFLDGFLFPGQRKHTKIKLLSGGERNRVLLAKLLLQHGNVLALDEPTNDLDLPTLRALEEALCAFEGVVLVVSHDRYFLDRVCTRVLFLDGSGRARFHEGEIEPLLEELRAVPEVRTPAAAAATNAKPQDDETRKKLRKAENELRKLPQRIEQLEAECKALDSKLADASLYLTPKGSAEAATIAQRRKELSAELDSLFARWQELESLISVPGQG